MKKYLLLVSLLPLAAMSQQKKAPVKNNANNVKKENVAAMQAVPSGGYVISAVVKGYPDSTPVALHNGNTGAMEATTQVIGNKFTLTGKLETPDVKVIVINNKQPYKVVFLDNSAISFTGSADSLDKAVVKGSKSHEEFEVLDKAIKPYATLFSQEGNTDSVARKAASGILTGYIRKYPNSYVTPLAVYRNFQVNQDIDQMEQLLGTLGSEVKTGPIGQFLAQQINEAKTMPAIGRPMPDFEHPDSTGKMVSIRSFRGKYVLIDFWASWCRPCRQENPNLVASYQKYKDRNFTILGISLDRAREPWLDAIRNDGLVWEQLSDLKGNNNELGVRFRIASIPQNFLLDPNGIVIAKGLRGGALNNKLASILGD